MGVVEREGDGSTFIYFFERYFFFLLLFTSEARLEIKN